MMDLQKTKAMIEITNLTIKQYKSICDVLEKIPPPANLFAAAALLKTYDETNRLEYFKIWDKYKNEI